jgi:NAD(P)-dependent dehydrogenase (short-subunit alcohol dehydrogenase family)
MTQDAVYATFPSLRGRSVLISGGATGIGEALVRAFAAQLARVAFLDIQDQAAQELIASISAAGFPAPEYFHCDLTDIAALQSAVAAVAGRFGSIDVLVNNAGNDTRHTVEEVTPEFWDQTLAVNLKHQFFLIQAVLPLMRRAGRGAIVNMSSIAWMIPGTNLPAYITAKAAVVGLTRTMAHEAGSDNIRVNCVLPGAIATERQKRLWYTPAYEAEVLANQALKRLLQPEEVARLVLFLAAEDSSAMTGQSYIIDGGWA